MSQDSSTPQTNTSNPSFRSLLTRDRWIEIGRIILVGLISLLYWQEVVPLPVLLVAIPIGLYTLVKTGVIDLVRERKIGTEIFVTVATVIALIGGEYVAAAVLMTIILIAEFIAELNTDRARASIKALIGSVPQVALVRDNGVERNVPIGELKVGDIVLVRGGEKIPVDGTDKLGQDTMFARIIALVEHAEDEQAPVQKLADKVSAWLIPVVFVFLIGVYLLTHDLRKIVTLLIFTSPAELGLATPLVMIAAIARAARNGILVKGGIYLESLAKADVMVFDKTGTLTVGEPQVVAIHPLDSNLTEEQLLSLVAAADRRSGHPLAKAVVERARQLKLDVLEPRDFEMIRGRGVKATVNGQAVLVGNESLLKENGVKDFTPEGEQTGTTVYVSIDGQSPATRQTYLKTVAPETAPMPSRNLRLLNPIRLLSKSLSLAQRFRQTSSCLHMPEARYIDVTGVGNRG